MGRPRPPSVAGAALSLAVLLSGLVAGRNAGTLDVAQGADAPAYVRIARTLLETGGLELPGPGRLEAAPQERFRDVFGSPWALTVDGRLLPKHPFLYGVVLVPGVALAGTLGARVTALLLGALLAGVATATAARRFGAIPAAAGALALFLLSPGGRNVIWGINVDTAIALLWLGALVLADSGRPLPAGLLGGLLLLLRPPALLLLAGLALVLAGRPRREFLRLAAGFVPPVAALLVLDTVWWGAPWVTAYDRVAVVTDGGLALATHSSRFTLPLADGLSILLLHAGGGLVATAPVCLVGLLGLALPAGRDRLSVAAAASAAVYLLFLSRFVFLARVPETAYRFALPLLVAAVFPLAALVHAAVRLRSRPAPPPAGEP